jgi:hypothetical protein
MNNHKVLFALMFSGILFSCSDDSQPPIVGSSKFHPADTTKLIDTSAFSASSDTGYKPVKLFNNPLIPSTDISGINVPIGSDIQALINKVPENGKAVFKLTNGNFTFSEPLTWKNKSIWLIGTNGTTFIFPNGKKGIVINRDHSVGRSRIENISVITNGVKTNPNATGIEVHAITDLYNVDVKNFAGRGIAYIADIGASKTDVSQSQIFNCEVAQCGNDGYYFQGGDANQINVIGCSARDNGGIGFYDNSFLGNQFFACMGHANKGGHYKVDGGNARATFTGCYGEEDSPPSFFGGVSRVFGGLLGWELVNRNGKLFYKDNGESYRGTGGYIVSGYAKVDTH